MTEEIKDELNVIIPPVIRREVTLMLKDEEGNPYYKVEEVISTKMRFGLMKIVNPLLFKCFPELMNELIGKGEGNPETKLSELLTAGLQVVFEEEMENVIDLLSATLEKPVSWIEALDPMDGIMLLSDWINLNMNMLTAKKKDPGKKK